MAIIHTPRVIASLVRGLRQRGSPGTSGTIGVSTPHVYKARVGVFDVDYLGHMNNAAFLSHAEYARWEMTAANNMLSAMYRSSNHFMVTSATCRYRAEVRPIFKEFQIDTLLAGINDRNLWMYQAFRFPEDGNDRIRAQVLVKGVTVHKGKVVDPRTFLIDEVGVSKDVVDSVARPSDVESLESMIETAEGLDLAMKEAASVDDKSRT